MVKDDKSSPPEKKSFAGKQLDLFQDFLCNTPEERERLSNTIELWDAVPKYFLNRRRQGGLRKDGYLPTASRDFVFKNQNLTVKIRPARVTVDGQDKEYYPSPREELVEDALRKLASNKGHGYLDSDRSGVSFTLHELRKELKKRGHTLSYYEVVESIEILSSAKIEISSLDGKSMYKTSPLTSLIAVSKHDLKKDPTSRWYADFSALVTEGIKKIKYRQYNYDLMMSHKGQLARWLHKRLSHNYVQASLLHSYTITMETISRDSGLLDCKRSNDNKRKLEQSLKELVGSQVLMRYESEEVRGTRNALLDIKYVLFPDHDFVAETKRANKRVLNNEEQLLTNGGRFSPQLERDGRLVYSADQEKVKLVLSIIHTNHHF